MALLTVFVTGLFVLSYVGSEEFVSVLKGTYTQKNSEALFTSASPGRPQGTYHNHEGYPPPHHNHIGHPSPDFQHTLYPRNDGQPPNSRSNPPSSGNNQPSFVSNPHIHGQPQFPPGFQHSPEFHSRNFVPKHEEREGRNSRQPEANDDYLNTTINEVPIDVLEKFDMYDVNDLLANYVDGYEEEDQSTLFSNRFGGQERNAAVIPARAGCSPENTTIPLASSEDPTIVYIPKCTKIQRCGGCCSHRLLSCQAIKKETISVSVVKTKYTGGMHLQFVEKELIPLERHLKCKCDCTVKAEHCLPHQEYRKDECRCICTNTDEERKCYKDVKKRWDLDTCSCQCRGYTECSTGAIYDHNECRCKLAPKRRYASYDRHRQGYSTEALDVSPIPK